MDGRRLTPAEIEELIDFIPRPPPCIPSLTADSIVEREKEGLRRVLRAQEDVVPAILPELKEMMRKQYVDSCIQPGEAVGIIAAQCIGEMTTQSTLNSVVWESNIVVYNYPFFGYVHKGPIGQFVDAIWKLSAPAAGTGQEQQQQQHLSSLPIPRTYGPVYIPTCDAMGSTSWKQVTSVIRHSPQLVPGTREDVVYENPYSITVITTASGREIRATTLGRSLLVLRRGVGWVPARGIDVKVGDSLPVIHSLELPPIHQQLISNTFPDIVFDAEIGQLLWIVWICCSHNTAIIHANAVFLQKLTTPTMNMIVKTFSGTKKGGGGGGEYPALRKTTFVITRDPVMQSLTIHSKQFASLVGFLLFDTNHGEIPMNLCALPPQVAVGFLMQQKDTSALGVTNKIFSALLNHVNNSPLQEQTREDVVISIVYQRPQEASKHPEWVYDFEVDDTRNFMLANGVVVRDSFHQAGITEKTVITGVPRFEEIINATRNQKASSCDVYFRECPTSVQQLRSIIGNSLVQVTVNDLITKVEINLAKEPEPWFAVFALIYDARFHLHHARECITIQLDHKRLFEHRLTPRLVAAAIESGRSQEEVCVVFSPDTIAQLDIFISTAVVSETLRDNNNNNNATTGSMLFLSEEEGKHAFLEEVCLPKIRAQRVCGMEGITNVFYTRVQNSDEWYGETEGSNLAEILTLPSVDITRTRSNNLWDVYDTLGIMATRETLMTELRSILGSISVCHPQLLVDWMTHSGSINSISRYTIKKENCGPLSKCSFEETLAHVVNAGIYGEEETTTGVSASIICGKRANFGSGLCSLVVERQALPQAAAVAVAGHME